MIFTCTNIFTLRCIFHYLLLTSAHIHSMYNRASIAPDGGLCSKPHHVHFNKAVQPSFLFPPFPCLRSGFTCLFLISFSMVLAT